jgi:hypothetical protein
MEAVLLKFDILNLSRYQFQRIIPPSRSAVVPKVIMMWTIDSSLKSGPTHEFRPVNEHVRSKNIFITTHMRKVKIRKQGANKKTGKAKHGAFPKLEDMEKKNGKRK